MSTIGYKLWPIQPRQVVLIVNRSSNAFAYISYAEQRISLIDIFSQASVHVGGTEIGFIVCIFLSSRTSFHLPFVLSLPSPLVALVPISDRNKENSTPQLPIFIDGYVKSLLLQPMG
jgi:hypothetical protein